MTTETQDAGAATTEAGETQEVGTATAVSEGAATGKPAEAEAKTETKTEAPAEVEVTFEMPEGIELDTASADAFKAVVKDKSLTEGQRYQKLADLAIQREQARFDAHRKAVEGWGAEVQADKELGDPENQAVARKFIDTFGTPELKEMLNRSGLGNHPAFVRLALKAGKAYSEDTIAAGRTGGNAPPKSAADILYGTPTK